MVPIEQFILLVRDSFVGAEHVYMNGSCFWFAKMLQAVYGGTLMENHSHVYLKIDGNYYDIRGRVYPCWSDGELTVAIEPTSHGKYDMLKNYRNIL